MAALQGLMRAYGPRMTDVLAARDEAADLVSLVDDAEERELQLFASLAQVSRQDLEGLKLSDYQRLQGAYFRLVQDDTDDTFAYASTGEAPGH